MLFRSVRARGKVLQELAELVVEEEVLIGIRYPFDETALGEVHVAHDDFNLVRLWGGPGNRGH